MGCWPIVPCVNQSKLVFNSTSDISELENNNVVFILWNSCTISLVHCNANVVCSLQGLYHFCHCYFQSYKQHKEKKIKWNAYIHSIMSFQVKITHERSRCEIIGLTDILSASQWGWGICWGMSVGGVWLNNTLSVCIHLVCAYTP